MLNDSITWLLPKPKVNLSLPLKDKEPREVFQLNLIRFHEILEQMASILENGPKTMKSQDIRLSPQEKVNFDEAQVVTKLGPPPPRFNSWWETITHVASILGSYDLKIENSDDRRKFIKLVAGTFISQGFLTIDHELINVLPDPTMFPEPFKWDEKCSMWRLDNRHSVNSQPNEMKKEDKIINEKMDHRTESSPITGSVFNRLPLFWLDPLAKAEFSPKLVLLLSFSESVKGRS